MGNLQLTETDMATLMIVKALDDFKTEDSADNNLDYKMRAFTFEEDEEGMTAKEYDDALTKFEQMGILVENEFILTLKGKALMVALSAMEKLTDDVKRGIINGTIKAVDFVKENKAEIVAILIAVWQKYN